MKIKVGYITGSLYVILAIVLILLFLSKEAKGAETYIEIGPSIISYQFSNSFTFILQERWNNKYAVALGIISEQHFNTCPKSLDRPDCVWDIKQQLLVGAERIIQGNFETLTWLNRVSFSVGPYWFQRSTRISSCNFNIRLGLDVKLWNRASIKFSHFSHGGTCDDITLENPNDTRFLDPECLHHKLCNTKPIPITGDYNLGQDALLFTWRF